MARSTPRLDHRPLPHRAQTGVTLLEMAVVVAIVGVLSLMVTVAHADYAQVRANTRAVADVEVARQAVRAFVLRNGRLPCPDLSANGDAAREGSGGNCPSGAQVGWLPYESIGLTRPDRHVRLRYAVSRNGLADLVAPADSGSMGIEFDGTSRLRSTLAAAARLTTGTDRPFLTGPGSAGAPEDCTRVQSNPAFVLVAPVSDRDDAGALHGGFDGVNLAMAAANHTCIAAPSRPADARYDDVVVAESASALLGWLTAQTR